VEGFSILPPLIRIPKYSRINFGNSRFWGFVVCCFLCVGWVGLWWWGAFYHFAIAATVWNENCLGRS